MILIGHCLRMICKHKVTFNLLDMMSEVSGRNQMVWQKLMIWIGIWHICIDLFPLIRYFNSKLII